MKTLAPHALDGLVNAGKSVYVMNTSVLPSGDKGLIVINFQIGTRREFFKMPPTFIPVAVTDSIPPKLLSESKDFRQSLVKGMLTLVDPDEAERYLNTPEALEEYESLMLSEHSMRGQGVTSSNITPGRPQVVQQDNLSSGPDQSLDAVDTVSNKVRGLVESLRSGDKDAKQVKMEIRRHQEAMTPVDLSYVIANTSDSDLVSFAQEALAQITGAAKKTAPVAAAKKTTPKKVVPTPASSDASFDFSPVVGDKMTPEEERADAEAKARAMSQQAIHGQSKINDEIGKLIR